MPVKHSTTVVIADDGISPVGTDEWNAGHIGMPDGSYNVMDPAYGAKGDGSTDDGTAIAAAITACPPGGTIYFPYPSSYYKITAPIALTKAIRVLGDGRPRIHQATAATKALDIQSSDVTIDNVYLTSTGGSGPIASGSIGIGSSGSSAASPYVRTRIFNCRIENFNWIGMYLSFLTDFQISRNYIYNVWYTGIGIMSSISGTITENNVSTIMATAGDNAYGIFTSRNGNDSLATYPRCQYIVIANNVIDTVPGWHGIDDHGSADLTIMGNTILNTGVGMWIGTSTNTAGNQFCASKNMTLVGNQIENTGSYYGTGLAGGGICINGVPTAFGWDGATGTCCGNSIKGQGLQSNSYSGGITLLDTDGYTVVGNQITECGYSGINFVNDNQGFTCVGNAIVDPWSTGASEAIGIMLNSDAGTGTRGYNRGTITGNTLRRSGKTATYVLVYGIFVVNITGQLPDIGVNLNDATTPLQDAGNYSYTALRTKKLGFYTTAPIAQQTGVAVTAAAIHAACVALGLFTA